ncbi:MAG: carbohydrate ABC transporter permease [Anaerolineae bacterium]|nr:carbohydrate ABC transporter permease [Anaerolineae bacterium]
MSTQKTPTTVPAELVAKVPLRERIRVRAGKILVYSFLVVVSAPIVVMYVWLFMQSISTQVLLGFMPQKLSLSNWRFLWGEVTIGVKTYISIWPVVLNTFLFAIGVTLLVVLVSTLSGFALSRFQFRGRTQLTSMTILLHAFPGVTLLIAIYYILFALWKVPIIGPIIGLNSILGVVFVKSALEIPMAAWIVKGFFDDISWDIEWAAYVDGCSRLQAWRRVILPVIQPGIASVAIFAFLAGWSEFLYLFTFIFEQKNFTLSLYVKQLIGDFKFVDYGLLSAAALFYMIPPMLFFLFTQKSLLKVSFGGIKG